MVQRVIKLTKIEALKFMTRTFSKFNHFLKIFLAVYLFLVALALFSKLDIIRAAKQVVGVLSFSLSSLIRARNNETIGEGAF